jgi:GSCFA family protein
MISRRRASRWVEPLRLLALDARRTLRWSRIPIPRQFRPAAETMEARQGTRAFDRWPTRHDKPNRLEPEAWPAIRPKWSLHGVRSVYTIGSCFARNIEQHFECTGYDVPTLRFAVPPEEWRGDRSNGILNKYTPPCIYQELEWALRVRKARSDRAREALLAEPLLDIGDDLVIDGELAGFVPVSRARGVERRRQLHETVEQAFEADVVAITLGLVEAWWDVERRRYLQQTPSTVMMQRFRKRFAFAPLRFAEALAHTRKAMDLLLKHGKPGLKILLTTSPVPLRTTFMLQDAIVANTNGKSILRAVCGEISETYDDVDYFPSYESAVLSDSSRVWNDNLLHVREAFIAKIVAHLVEPYFGRPELSADEAPAKEMAPVRQPLAATGE